MVIRLRSLLALAAAGALLVSACTVTDPGVPEGSTEPVDGQVEPSEPAGSPFGGTLRIGLSNDPVSLDPRFLVDEVGEQVVDLLFDPLVRLDEDGELVPGAAERWEVDASGREFRFHLRPATFHDGAPVTAEDFARTFTRLVDETTEPISFLGYLLEAVEGHADTQRSGVPLSGIEVVDDRTLVIRLSEPDFEFPTMLSEPSLVPLPVGADLDAEQFALQPIGNGTFAMSGAREPGAFIRLSRYEEHWTPVLLDEVVFTVYSDVQGPERQWADLRDGQLHVAEVAPQYRAAALETFGRSEDGYRGPGLLDGVTATVYLYGFDTTRPPFDDARVRRAVSLAVDREALADEVMLGSRVAATAIVPPSVPGSQPGACDACRHDPTAAADLLAEVRAEAAAGLGEQAGGEAGEPVAEEGAPASDDAEDTAPESQDEGSGPEDTAPESQDEGSAPEDTAPESQDEGSAPEDSGGLDTADDDATSDEDPEQHGDAGVGGTEAPSVLDRLTLTHSRGDTHAAIAEHMAADISEALDIEVDFQARALQPFLHAVTVGELTVFRLGWEGNVPSPETYLRPLFHSSQIGADNLTRYERSEVDELLDRARSTEGERTRRAGYREAESMILDDLPAMPLLWYRHNTAVAPEVRNLVLSPLGRLHLGDVWLDVEAG